MDNKSGELKALKREILSVDADSMEKKWKKEKHRRLKKIKREMKTDMYEFKIKGDIPSARKMEKMISDIDELIKRLGPVGMFNWMKK